MECLTCFLGALLPRQMQWSFDLAGVTEMYASYEDASFWPFLSAPTQGICVDFVRAQQSSYIWSLADMDRLRAYGHRVHLLPNAGTGCFPTCAVQRLYQAKAAN